MHGFNENITLKFASILTDIYTSIDVNKSSDQDDYNEKLSQKFKLNLNKYEHGIIESCRFLIEDTEEAISNFDEYGLSGPTKYKNIGESYLRLYGLLNALYLQMSIPKVLRELFNLNSNCVIQDLINRIENLKIIDFRHKIASHSLNYKNKKESNYYRLSQKTICFDEIHLISKNGLETIELKKEIIVFKKLFHEVLILVFEEIVKKLFVPKSKRVSSIESSLNLIKLQLDEPLIILPFNEEEEIKRLEKEIIVRKKEIQQIRLLIETNIMK